MPFCSPLNVDADPNTEDDKKNYAQFFRDALAITNFTTENINLNSTFSHYTYLDTFLLRWKFSYNWYYGTYDTDSYIE